jgi:hypothetical protein
MPSYRKPNSLNSARPNTVPGPIPENPRLAHPYEDDNDKENFSDLEIRS